MVVERVEGARDGGQVVVGAVGIGAHRDKDTASAQGVAGEAAAVQGPGALSVGSAAGDGQSDDGADTLLVFSGVLSSVAMAAAGAQGLPEAGATVTTPSSLPSMVVAGKKTVVCAP